MNAIILFLVFILQSACSYAQNFTTVAEKSGWKTTGRAVEVEALCKSYQKTFPSKIECGTYGLTPEGRELKYLLIKGDKNAPVVWLQAGIHAGEIDGKDAVFKILKEEFVDKKTPQVFEGLTVVFIPIVNLDGHERFGKWNRPNQVGPEEMGWRTTAQNLNMNRDFTKTDAPEMQALLKFWNKMDPVLSLDLHVTDGAQFVPEVGIIVAPNEAHGKTFLHSAGTVFETGMVTKLNERGTKALPFYPSFEKDDDPTTGFSRYVSLPRFAHGYWYGRNRLGVLIESHSWKDYATRVRVHYETVRAALELAQRHGKEWIRITRDVDESSLNGSQVDLEFKRTNKHSMIDFPGYEFTYKKSVVTGEKVVRYFPDRPQTWKVPFYEELVPALTVTAPQEGYYVPVTEVSWLKPRLDTHGIKFETLKKPLKGRLEVFRATQTELSAQSFEGRQTMKIQGQWIKEESELPKGSIYIPLRQKSSRLILQLFEPLSQDSYLSWGFFNRFFEPKEYMEDYVLEDVAREMLKQESVRRSFEEMLKDKDFAKDPKQRFKFFYSRHSSWDKAFNKYPIIRR